MAELVKKYQQYAEYKDSGVEWLGEIPAKWNITALKRYCKVKGGYAFASDIFSNVGEPVIRIGDIKADGSISLENCKFISTELAKSSHSYLVEKGQLLMAMTGATIGKAGVYINDSPAYLNQRVGKFVIDNDGLNYNFLWYTLKTNGYQEYIKLTAFGGAQPNISDTGMVDYISCFPSLSEQTQIANFLDHETSQIDTLIEKQQTLIQLLKEKRQAVISHAVTKGLNPDAPMKDSGVEWLGDVPEHWKITKLKWKANTTSGGTPTTSKYEDYYEDGDIPWIRTTDLNNDKLNETPIMITPKAVRDSACSLLPKNSVLIAMYGGAGSIGKHSLLNFESTINQAVCGVLPSEAFVADYLHRFYEFYRPFWMIGAAGTRKDPNIGQDNIKEAKTLIPPLNEQNQIADYLDKMQSHFDALTESAEKGIQLMQERRTALISAAVTGKIDVRDFNQNLKV